MGPIGRGIQGVLRQTPLPAGASADAPPPSTAYRGSRIRVFDGGRAFSHEEMIDAAFARFQYHGFRFSGNGSYDLAAAMPSEEVTEKTERALELAAALEGDEWARFYH